MGAFLAASLLLQAMALLRSLRDLLAAGSIAVRAVREPVLDGLQASWLDFWTQHGGAAVLGLPLLCFIWQHGSVRCAVQHTRRVSGIELLAAGLLFTGIYMSQSESEATERPLDVTRLLADMDADPAELSFEFKVMAMAPDIQSLDPVAAWRLPGDTMLQAMVCLFITAGVAALLQKAPSSTPRIALSTLWKRLSQLYEYRPDSLSWASLWVSLSLWQAMAMVKVLDALCPRLRVREKLESMVPKRKCADRPGTGYNRRDLGRAFEFLAEVAKRGAQTTLEVYGPASKRRRVR